MTTILFFGGYLSSPADILAWEESTQKQLPDYPLLPYHYPIGATAEDPLAKFKNTAIIATKIKNDSGQCVIVGHSSGCAIANAVADKALLLGAKNFKLVCLDGFMPSKELLALPNTSCWSAKCGDKVSLNYNELKGVPNFHSYQAVNCTGIWDLHFSLVNKNSAGITSISEGYHNCDANLIWLAN